MMPKQASVAEIERHLSALRESPVLIARVTDGLDEARLRQAPEAKAWSLVEILAHVRSSAEVWSYSIYAMLTLEAPMLAPIHPRDWAKTQRYKP